MNYITEMDTTMVLGNVKFSCRYRSINLSEIYPSIHMHTEGCKVSTNALKTLRKQTTPYRTQAPLMAREHPDSGIVNVKEWRDDM